MNSKKINATVVMLVINLRVVRNVRPAPPPEIQMPFTPGGFETAIKLRPAKCNIVISKIYSVQEWLEFSNANKDLLPRIMVSSNDFDYLNAVLRSVSDIKQIHLLIGHVFSQDFEDLVNKIRRNYPFHAIIVGSRDGG